MFAFIVLMTTVSPEVASNYDIRNGEGKLIFKAVEQVDPVVKDLHEIHDQTKPPFVLSIIEMKTGKEVIKINGNLARGVVSSILALQIYNIFNRLAIIHLLRQNHPLCSIIKLS